MPRFLIRCSIQGRFLFEVEAADLDAAKGTATLSFLPGRAAPKKPRCTTHHVSLRMKVEEAKRLNRWERGR